METLDVFFCHGFLFDKFHGSYNFGGPVNALTYFTISALTEKLSDLIVVFESTGIFKNES